MSKALDRHKTNVGKQRKALAAIANATLDAIKERDEGRAPGMAMDKLKRRVVAIPEGMR